MDALEALHTRNSVNLLTEPSPTKEQLENIFKAGLRACDHKNLKPVRFLTIEGDARNKLGELFVEIKLQDNPEFSEMDKEKLRNKPLRAPIIILVIATITDDPKVPEIEQQLSVGASAQMMMTAAHAQDVGAIWRSGAIMFDKRLHKGIGLANNEQILGFLYMGTPRAIKALSPLALDNRVQAWTGSNT